MRNGIVRLAAWLVAAVALTACYESDREIIPVELGEALPYEHDLVGWAGDEEATHFVRGAAGQDMRFEHHREYEVNTGVLRAFRLKGDIFAVQVHEDDASYYSVLFYRVTPDTVARVEPVSADAVKALAARSGVTLTNTGFGYQKLAGEPAAKLAFVRGHARLDFRVWQKQR
jgi:hypothetical protein